MVGLAAIVQHCPPNLDPGRRKGVPPTAEVVLRRTKQRSSTQKEQEPVTTAGSCPADGRKWPRIEDMQCLVPKARTVRPSHTPALDLLLPVSADKFSGGTRCAQPTLRLVPPYGYYGCGLQEQNTNHAGQNDFRGTRFSWPQKSAMRLTEARNTPGSPDLLTKAFAPASRHFAVVSSSSAQVRKTTGVK